jgi:hypothetical protein
MSSKQAKIATKSVLSFVVTSCVKLNNINAIKNQSDKDFWFRAKEYYRKGGVILYYVPCTPRCVQFALFQEGELAKIVDFKLAFELVNFIMYSQLYCTKSSDKYEA